MDEMTDEQRKALYQVMQALDAWTRALAHEGDDGKGNAVAVVPGSDWNALKTRGRVALRDAVEAGLWER